VNVTFTPAEAASITGASPDRQRQWRKQGFMPAGDGRWQRFTVGDLCRLYVILLDERATGRIAPHLDAISLAADAMEKHLRGVPAPEFVASGGDHAPSRVATLDDLPEESEKRGGVLRVYPVKRMSAHLGRSISSGPSGTMPGTARHYK